VKQICRNGIVDDESVETGIAAGRIVLVIKLCYFMTHLDQVSLIFVALMQQIY